MKLADLRFFALLPFAVLADVLKDFADRLDARLADAPNGDDA